MFVLVFLGGLSSKEEDEPFLSIRWLGGVTGNFFFVPGVAWGSPQSRTHGVRLARVPELDSAAQALESEEPIRWIRVGEKNVGWMPQMGVAQIKQEGLRRCWSRCPLTRVPCWYRFFEPQPNGCGGQNQ